MFYLIAHLGFTLSECETIVNSYHSSSEGNPICASDEKTQLCQQQFDNKHDCSANQHNGMHFGENSIDVFGNTATAAINTAVSLTPVSSFMSYIASNVNRINQNILIDDNWTDLSIYSTLSIPRSELNDAEIAVKAITGASSIPNNANIIPFIIAFKDGYKINSLTDAKMQMLFPSDQINLRNVSTLMASSLNLGKPATDAINHICTRTNLVSQQVWTNVALYAKAFSMSLLMYRCEEQRINYELRVPREGNTAFTYINFNFQ